MDRKLYEMNPLGRFSDRAQDYAQYRPSYPQAAIAAILAGFDRPVAADIGAGTGISARLLAEAGVSVFAIEPNAKMRQVATPHPLVEFRQGTAEATLLPDASVDVVTCFQAFHWFNPEASLAEFHRILKPSGRLALVWNNRDREDEFTARYTHLVQVASNYHPAESRFETVEPLQTSPLFANFRGLKVANVQELNLPGLIGRMRSTSYAPQSGSGLEELVVELQDLYAQWAGDGDKVVLRYSTHIYLAEPKAV